VTLRRYKLKTPGIHFQEFLSVEGKRAESEANDEKKPTVLSHYIKK
jgi:hypothetical protein